LSDGPIAKEHHEYDNEDVDECADDVFNHQHIVAAVAIDDDGLNAGIGDESDDLVDEGHRIEDQIQLAKAVRVTHEPDYPDERHHYVHEDVGDLYSDRPDEDQHGL
jgi:hypothetical protein